MDWLDVFLGSGIRMATPILLAALACLPTMWTRDLNIGLEGIMIFGAFFGVAIGIATGSGIIAVLGTLGLAAVCGLAFGLAVTKLRVDVFVAGIVLFVGGGALTAYLLDVLFDVKGNLTDPRTPTLPVVTFPGIDDVPLASGLLSGHGLLTWVAAALVPLLWWMDRRLVLARRMRAAGLNPAALAAAGSSVDGPRVAAQVWCFVLCALAGVQISLSQLSLFTVGMTGGLGFVALAAAIFSSGRVPRAAVISLGFGLATAATFQVDKNTVSPDLVQALPYLLALLGLIVLSRRSAAQSHRSPDLVGAESTHEGSNA